MTCPRPPIVADGTFSPNKESYQYKDVVEYSCHKDFILSGVKSMSCSLDGTFKPAPPTCNSKCFFSFSNRPHCLPNVISPVTDKSHIIWKRLFWTIMLILISLPAVVDCEDPNIANSD